MDSPHCPAVCDLKLRLPWPVLLLLIMSGHVNRTCCPLMFVRDQRALPALRAMGAWRRCHNSAGLRLPCRLSKKSGKNRAMATWNGLQRSITRLKLIVGCMHLPFLVVSRYGGNARGAMLHCSASQELYPFTSKAFAAESVRILLPWPRALALPKGCNFLRYVQSVLCADCRTLS